MSEIDTYSKRLDHGKSFVFGERSLNKYAGDFWAWAYSDLMDNMGRAVLAEYIVALAVGQDHEIRKNWQSWDIKTGNGKKVEVKVAAYLQRWDHGEENRMKNLRFNLKETREYDFGKKGMAKMVSWNSDIYVFALFSPRKWADADPMNLTQWEFWVFSQKELKDVLNGRKSISIKELRKLTDKPCVGFDKLAAKIEEKGNS